MSQTHDAVLAFIVELLEGRGYPPSMGEIATRMGWASRSTAHHYVDDLVKQGKLRRVPGHPRTLMVVKDVA